MTQILVALHSPSRTIVIAGHGLEVAAFPVPRAADRRKNPRREHARGGASGDPCRRPRRGGSLVDPHGRLWRAGTALAQHRTMHQWRARLARSRMQSLQDAREHAAGRHPPPARHAVVETGSVPEMPLMPQGPARAAGAHDQADREARDHALSVGASGRGEVASRGDDASRCRARTRSFARAATVS